MDATYVKNTEQNGMDVLDIELLFNHGKHARSLLAMAGRIGNMRLKLGNTRSERAKAGERDQLREETAFFLDNSLLLTDEKPHP